MNDFLWIVLPYAAIIIMVGATLARYIFFENSWTSKSSQFLAKKSLLIWGPLFHLGLLFTFGGHFGGIIVPKEVTDYFAVTEEMYHQGALAGGTAAGIMLVAGFCGILRRRYGNVIMQVNTSGIDNVLYILLFITIVTGCMATGSNISGEFDYRTSIAPWFRGIMLAAPDSSLMSGVPLLFKLHLVSGMLVMLVFPFTRLVHCLSIPFSYFGRAAIIYRKL